MKTGTGLPVRSLKVSVEVVEVRYPGPIFEKISQLVGEHLTMKGSKRVLTYSRLGTLFR